MLASCLLALALIPAADPKPRLDPDGLPLPAEAVQRFGSQRFLVNHLKAATFSPDGKTVYTISVEAGADDRGGVISPGLIAWEVPTGKMLWQVGVDRWFEQVAADPDGKGVWVEESLGKTVWNETTETDRVRYSARDGKELDRLRVSRGDAGLLHPTGTVAWIRAGEPERSDLVVTDRSGATTTVLPLAPVRDHVIQSLAWSPSADRLYLTAWNGRTKTGYATAVDVAKAKSVWVIEPKAKLQWQVTPDGTRLVGLSQDPPAENETDRPRTYLCRWDARTGKEVGALDLDRVPTVDEGPTLDGRVYFSPDGKTLLVVDDADRTTGIDLATWKKVVTRLKIPRHAVFSPDRKTYLAQPLGVVDQLTGRHAVLYDTASGKPLSRDEPPLGDAYPDDRDDALRFSADSKRLIRTGHDCPQVEWEVSTGRTVGHTDWNEVAERLGQQRGRFLVNPLTSALPSAISPDGSREATRKKTDDSFRIRVRNLDRPRLPPVTLVAGWSRFGDYTELCFTPDNRHLVGLDPANGLHIWDTAKGGKPAAINFAGVGKERDNQTRYDLHIRSDGRRVAVVERHGWRPGRAGLMAKGPWRVGVYDIPTAKLVRHVEGEGAIELLGWTRTGNVVGLVETTAPESDEGSWSGWIFRPQLLFFDPDATGVRLSPLEHGVRCWAVSPVGDAVAVGSSDGLRLYEASTGKLRHRFREQTRPVQVVAFSPDGRSLAAESVDGPLLLWDVRGDLTRPAKPDAGGWEAAWTALGGDGAEAAFRAVRLFALHPDDGVPELKRRFAERKSPTAEAVAALVQQLDDRDYQTRERATKELRELGFAAFSALKKALADNPPEELRARAERLLAATTSPDVRRAERAVEAMQLANTEAAKKLLAEWAKGPVDDVLTKAARRVP
jgi:WD40 repeat protein